MTNYGKNNFRAIISVQYFFESFSKKPIVIGSSQLEIRNQDLFSVTRTKKETNKQKNLIICEVYEGCYFFLFLNNYTVYGFLS